LKKQSRLLIEKARHAIHAAEVLIREGETDFAAGRAYYAMFYVASALLAEHGFRATKHAGVHALFGEHFVKPGWIGPKFHRFLLDAFDRRLHADYSFEASITETEGLVTIDQAREFLTEVESLLLT
jgi:uncharacterized protein (UPF0332 family)